jgi:hypothetical protein
LEDFDEIVHEIVNDCRMDDGNPGCFSNWSGGLFPFVAQT